MSLDKLNAALVAEVAALEEKGAPRRRNGSSSATCRRSGARGPRYRLQGSDGEFIRMNSNSYLSLSHHPGAARGGRRGVARVRRRARRRAIHRRHVRAARRARGADRARSSAGRRRASSTRPTPRSLGLAITLSGPDTFWVGDALNHNCIIRAMRIANVPSAQRAIFKHNDLADLEQQLAQVPDGTGRVVVIFDGIFSMRGDNAPLDAIAALVARARGSLPRRRRHRHGRLARDRRLRRDGPRHRRALRRAGRHLHRHVRQGVRRERRVRRRQPGAHRGGPAEGRHLHLHEPARRGGLRRGGQGGRASPTAPRGASGSRTCRRAPTQFRAGLESLGFESIPGRTPSCRCSCATPSRDARDGRGLFDRGILAVGLTFPVVPRGDETIRFQINAAHTESDIGEVLGALQELKGTTPGA